MSFLLNLSDGHCGVEVSYLSRFIVQFPKVFIVFIIIHAHPYVFTQRVINVWNNLPMSVEFGSLSAFTQSIGRVY